MKFLCEEIELTDILHEIQPLSDDEIENELWKEENIIELMETLLELMNEYLLENKTAISDPDFDETFLEDIKELFLLQLEEMFKGPLFSFGLNHDLEETFEEEFDIILKETMKIFYSIYIPERSQSESVILEKPNIEIISNKIAYLSSLPQPTQRTPEWYEFRHNLITASNAYKAFESEATKNQLIYEKCHQPEISTKSSFVNITSPFHWGQKYEPISVSVYEEMYHTQIKDFGCIQHSKYKFLGASPDGINVDPHNERYGRMLEIKNIVNREINGIPKKEYWIQMQLQMETCDLDECDFLETKFTEYENEEEFKKDGTFLSSSKNEKKGIIMYFCTKDGCPHYIYKPVSMGESEFELWESEHIEKMDFTWIKNIYWKLEKLSCVLVLRNKRWFEDNIGTLADIWNIIETERITGYQHREPKKRIKNDSSNPKNQNSNSDFLSGKGCFLKVVKSSVISDFFPQSSLKIRTESIDETMEKTKHENTE